jgi:esterase
MSYPSMAADVLEYMRRGGLAGGIVAGHSMGGKVAMELAFSARARVDGLLVLDIAPSAYDRAHDHILEGMLSVDVRSLQTRDEADRRLAPFIPEPRVRQFLLTNLRRRDGGGFEWRLNLEAIAATYDHLLAEVSKGRRSNVPALFLRGGRSDHVGPAEERAIMEAFPNARIDTAPGAGHWIGADAPDEVVAAAERLAERVRRGPDGAPTVDDDGQTP